MRTSYQLALLIAASLSVAGSAHAESVIIIAARDTTLYEDAAGALSNGAGDHMFAGRTLQAANALRRALIAFDIAASVPAGSTIESAALALYMSRTNFDDVRDVTLHRALAMWGEGASHAPGLEGSGAPSAVGDATWIHSIFDSDWWETAGGDFAPDDSATTAVGTDGFYQWGSTPELVLDVQQWLDVPASNFGWVVVGDESGFATAKRFDTRENPTLDQRPALTVEFTRPIVGACCDGMTGICANDVAEDTCDCLECVWTSQTQCVDLESCSALRGACCDPEGMALGEVDACEDEFTYDECQECGSDSCQWFAGESCVDVTERGDCPAPPEAVPAISVWGLLVTTLSLLTAVRVFTRNRPSVRVGTDPTRT